MITLEQERATHLYVADKEKVGKVQTVERHFLIAGDDAVASN